MGKFIDLKGQKFGRLTVLAYAEYRNEAAHWICLCDCGAEVIVNGASLRNGHTRSCGCLSRELAATRCRDTKTVHGLRNTRLFGIWNGMKQRCNNPKRPKFPNYGGRGVTVCAEWLNDFKAFYDWAVANGYTDELTIDRIDVNGNYCPENCRWVPKAEQAYNKTTSERITYNGETKTLAEWAKIKGLKTSTLWVRLYKHGWGVVEALETPVSHGERLKKAVIQYTTQGEFVREWDSAREASISTGVNVSCICACCKGRNRTAGGYIWKYKTR